jgi:amino acid transporter
MAVQDSPAPAPARRSSALRREVGLIGLMWASVGSIIGSGWLFGAQKGLIAAGPAAMISWIVGGLLMMVLALIHAELGGMYPVSGGTARFPHYAFGGAAGASFGWFSWLQAATVAPIEVSAMITYSQHWSFAHGWLNPITGVLTTSGLIVAVILMAILTGINFFGIKILATVNSVATWWKIAVPLLVILVLAFSSFHGSNFTAADGFAPDGVHGILAAISTSGIIFSYLGFEQADQLAGEAKNPKRDIPLAIIGAMTIGIIIYVALQLTFLLALPDSAIGPKWAAAGKHFYTAFTGPFAEVATLVGLGWLAFIIYADAVISPAGTGLIYTTGSSRVSYGLSRNGYFPTPFEWVNERGVPWAGLILAFVAGCVCFLPFPSWQSLVGLITSASVLMYAGAPLSLGAFRRRLPNAERPYRLPAAEIMSPFGFIISGLVILWSGWDTDWKLGVAILLGYAVLGLTRVMNWNDKSPHLHWRAASWLPVYLVGLGIIVYVSNFGPMSSPWLSDWPGIFVTAVFSLIIYYWAMAVALPTEEIESMVNEVVLPEEEGLEMPAH